MYPQLPWHLPTGFQEPLTGLVEHGTKIDAVFHANVEAVAVALRRHLAHLPFESGKLDARGGSRFPIDGGLADSVMLGSEPFSACGERSAIRRSYVFIFVCPLEKRADRRHVILAADRCERRTLRQTFADCFDKLG
jgi:hypothetical protein